jgi:hypothetical protein
MMGFSLEIKIADLIGISEGDFGSSSDFEGGTASRALKGHSFTGLRRGKDSRALNGHGFSRAVNIAKSSRL